MAVALLVVAELQLSALPEAMACVQLAGCTASSADYDGAEQEYAATEPA